MQPTHAPAHDRPQFGPPAPAQPVGGLRRYLVAPLMLFLVSLAVFRTAGVLGIAPLDGWPAATRLALVVMFAFTAAAHFGRQKESLIQMVPSWMPRPRLVVAVTGVLELFGALGLLLPATAPLAGIGLAVLLVAIFPANVTAARQQVMIDGKPATPLWFRTLVQVIFIAALLWAVL